MGRRKLKRPGLVLETFLEASRLAATSAAATRHLAPDGDSCAVAIEALFACRAAKAAEMVYGRCREAFLPNPALYSALIFGRLSCEDGQGATDAMMDMWRGGGTSFGEARKV